VNVGSLIVLGIGAVAFVLLIFGWAVLADDELRGDRIDDEGRTGVARPGAVSTSSSPRVSAPAPPSARGASSYFDTTRGNS
jgi:hypothetical protein